MSSELSFEARNKPLAEVLFSQRRYRIPRYQRPYAWGIDQVSELWEDLITNSEPYFLGSLIFNTQFEKEEGVVDIIDGQQRLLTITILSAVLRDVTKSISSDRANLFQRKDIAIEDRNGNESFRVTPADSLTEYFRKYIQVGIEDILQSTPASPEETRVKENYIYLKEKVEVQIKTVSTQESKLEKLNHLRTKLSNLVVISVEITNEEDAYEIFETTNARGLDLSVADLLKNLIFRKIKPDGGEDDAKDAWQEMTSDIESTNTELRKFIRYFWISKYGFVTEKGLYRAIKNRITDWRQLLNDLRQDSITFNNILEGGEQDFKSFKHGVKIYESVFSFRVMRVTQCYVFLLSVLRNYENLGTDPTRVIQFIERFTFQYSAVCKLPTNRIEKIYSRYALKIEDVIRQGIDNKTSGKIQAIFQEIEKELRMEAPSEQEFKLKFMELSYKNTEEGRTIIKYVLARINASLAKTDEHRINFSSVNIEHILPRNPHKDWKLSKKEISNYVNKLGNLTLLSIKLNSQAQNVTIDKKLPELETSELAVAKDAVNFIHENGNVWDESLIEKRHMFLADLAHGSIWSLN
jgi:uncharacterized protein with ParB-like and HNH nuclease domain